MSKALENLANQRSDHIARLAAITIEITHEIVSAEHHKDTELRDKLSKALGSIANETDTLIPEILATI